MSKLSHAPRSLFPHKLLPAALCAALVLALAALLALPAAAQLCNTGVVIWNGTQQVGCKFTSWGSTQQSQCNGAVSFQPRPDGNCWICVTSSWVSVVEDPSQWSQLKMGTHAASASPADFSCLGCLAPIDQGDDISRNRDLPADGLQVTTFYDGSNAGGALFEIEYIDRAGDLCWLPVDDIWHFGSRIATREYDLDGAILTGNFRVSGATPNGTVDGLAFGIYWKDSASHILRSQASANASTPDFVGTWPLAMSDSTFTARTPQITDWTARQQAKAMIYGAALLPNGTYGFQMY